MISKSAKFIAMNPAQPIFSDSRIIESKESPTVSIPSVQIPEEEKPKKVAMIPLKDSELVALFKIMDKTNTIPEEWKILIKEGHFKRAYFELQKKHKNAVVNRSLLRKASDSHCEEFFVELDKRLELCKLRDAREASVFSIIEQFKQHNEPEPPTDEECKELEELQTFTCDKCSVRTQCPFVYDEYNVDGACLAEK